jgi:hypothetical protein
MGRTGAEQIENIRHANPHAANAGPTAALRVIETDAEERRLRSMLADGIEPRTPGASVCSVPCVSGKTVMVVRVPRSWEAPHMVRLEGLSKFYGRSGAEVFQMDVLQIRRAFEDR